MFYISSVERDAVGYDKAAVAAMKRDKLRAAAGRLASSGRPELAMTPAQLDRFAAHWGAALRGTDRIRAENDEYFALVPKMESWLSGDRARAPDAKTQGTATGRMDPRPISERMSMGVECQKTVRQ